MSAVFSDGKEHPKSILGMVLENMRQNVISGIKEAQDFGVDCKMPEFIEVDMGLNSDGLPCRDGDLCAARLKTKIFLHMRHVTL
jgi:hypothetical protein